MSSSDAEIKVKRRSDSSNEDQTTPLFTLAWQTMQRFQAQQAAAQQEREAALGNESKAWIVLADECFRLRQLVENHAEIDELVRNPLSLICRRLAQVLTDHGIELAAPVGDAYTAELAEVLENTGQYPQPGLTDPQVKEVLQPIIYRQSHLLRLGKAIIAVPEQHEDV